MSWESFGLHTRLHYVIKSSGGLNRGMRIAYLATTYSISTEQAELLVTCPVEELIKTRTKEEIIDLAISDKQMKEEEAQKSLANLNRMANHLFMACPSLVDSIAKWSRYMY